MNSATDVGLATLNDLHVWRASVETFFAETLRELTALSAALASHGAAVETGTAPSSGHGPEDISHQKLSDCPTPRSDTDTLPRESAKEPGAAPVETNGDAAATSSDQSQQRLAELARRLEAQLRRATLADSSHA